MASSPPLDEFARIARFFAPLAAPGGLKLLDDAALLAGPAGFQYVLTADAIVEGVHFRPDDPPATVAQKLLRVNLSDLAAKGAVPVGYLLTTALPPAHDEAWLAEFARGLAADQKRYRIGLLGGDSTATSGPAVLSLTAIGRVAKGRALLRAKAKPGDRVFVSGTLGDAALGLAVLRGDLPDLDALKLGARGRDFLVRRYRLPEPRLELGRRLIGAVHAAADISDGLVADLGHICKASHLGATIDASLLPLSRPARTLIGAAPERRHLALTAGDDYELVFAAPAAARRRLLALGKSLGVPVTEIGRLDKGKGVRIRDAAGREIKLDRSGYRHFG